MLFKANVRVVMDERTLDWKVQERVRLWMFPWPKIWVTRAFFYTLAAAWNYAKTL
jgi:hypothetical protein